MEQQSEDERPPAIDEIVGLLNRYSAGALAQLRFQYPRSKELLQTGIIAGETDDAIAVRIATAIKGLAAAVEICRERIPTIRSRIARSYRWQFIGQVFSILAGTSLLGAISADFSKVAEYAIAALALGGSLASLFSQYAAGGAGGIKSLAQLHEQLSDHRFEAQQLGNELELALSSKIVPTSLSKLVRRANSLCAAVVRAESRTFQR
jgi:hypothetical protein